LDRQSGAKSDEYELERAATPDSQNVLTLLGHEI
jgi:hypothetical protein